MSYTSDIKDYIRTIIATVDSDLVEWTGRFDLDNIPRNVRNKSYHINVDTINSEALNDLNIFDRVDITLTLFIRAARNEMLSRDNAIDLAHNIRLELVKPANAMVGSHIKNVILDKIEIEENSGDDNSIILPMDITMELIF